MEQEDKEMNMHYLSHPFSGDEEKNRAAAEAIQRELQEKHPRVIYVNPLANFKALAGMEYDTIMGYCLELLYKCRAITMTGDYRASKGCMIELAYAREYHIPVFFYDAEKHEYVEEM